MHLLRRHLRSLSGFVLLAALVFAVLPTLARAAAAGAGEDPWAQICSTGGSLRLAPTDVEASSSPAAPALAQVSDHCPLCGSVHLEHALAAQARVRVPSVEPSDVPLPARLSGPRRSGYASHPPPSRGPPRFS